jgi:hypothetical protein
MSSYPLEEWRCMEKERDTEVRHGIEERCAVKRRQFTATKRRGRGEKGKEIEEWKGKRRKEGKR